MRAIGVSNFTVKHLQELLEIATIKPTVNQVELHPYLPQTALVKFCTDHDIVAEAYSPLGSGGQPSLLHDPTIVQLAKQLEMTPAQLLLSWGISRGTPVVFKTANPYRLTENFNLGRLDAEAMREINNIGHTFRFCNPVDLWKRDCFNGDDRF